MSDNQQDAAHVDLMGIGSQYEAGLNDASVMKNEKQVAILLDNDVKDNPLTFISTNRKYPSTAVNKACPEKEDRLEEIITKRTQDGTNSGYSALERWNDESVKDQAWNSVGYLATQQEANKILAE